MSHQGRLLALARSSWPYCVWALALVFALPSVAYPYGRDQALYFYVAREWVERGLLPYRDLFDQKPPGIYLIYAMANGLLGERQWAIRVVEVVATLAGGFLVARAAAPFRPTLRSAAPSALLLVAFYFGTFNYWDTAQCEMWEGLLLVAAQAILVSTPPSSVSALWSGLCVGAAFVVKSPSAVAAPVLLTELCVLARAQGMRASALGRLTAWFVLGVAGLPLACVAYFAWRNGFPDLYDVLVGYNQFYVSHKRLDLLRLVAGTIVFWYEHAPIPAAAAAVLWAFGLRTALRNRTPAVVHVLATGGLVVALVVGVLAQGKLYYYHWVVLVPVLAVCVLQGLQRLAPERQAIAVFALSGAIFCFGPRWYPGGSSLASQAVSLWRYAVGTSDRSRYLADFRGGYGYVYLHQEEVGTYIRQHSGPGDTLHVRGFEPAVYQVAGLHSPSRFFAEFPLIDPELAYRREEWLAQHTSQLLADPPRWLVSTGDEELAAARGYQPVMCSGFFLVYERPRDGAHLEAVARPVVREHCLRRESAFRPKSP